jgi:hypothetical protein
MQVKKIKTEDFYPTMQKWWDGNKETHVSPSMLPESTFVCFNDKDVPTYSMCFYNTDSNLCWIGWQLVNPEVKKEDKKGCFRYLFEEIEKYARYVGYHVIFTTSKTPSVMGTLESIKFTKGDADVNHYTKIL